MDEIINISHQLRPLELMTLPCTLNGRSGTNRTCSDLQLMSADNDVDAIKAWLARYLDSKPTFESYRKEAERLLLWSITVLAKPISSLTHEDLLVYKHFIQNPKPEADWVMTKRKVSRSDPSWRPFAGPLSPSSQRQAIVILNSMFAWLVNAGYLKGNPLSLSRHRLKKSKPRITRVFDEELWIAVKTTVNAMPRDTPRDREQYARIRWLLSLLYLTGMRISEVTNNVMGCFFVRKHKDGGDRWWLEITGKGGKTRLIPATNELMLELRHYRREMDLTLQPEEGEITPLFLPIGKKPRSLSRAAVHVILKKIFKMTADRIKLQGHDSELKVKKIRTASAHWLRHTAGSNMANKVDLRYVRDTLGHESISTTNIYLHAEDDDRHDSHNMNHILGW